MRRIVSVDLETNGFSPKTCDIFQIGAVDSTGATFNEYINIKVPLPILRFTGANQADISRGGTLKAVMQRFAEWLDRGEYLLVGHNFNRFDRKFLDMASERTNVRLPHPVDIIDTLEWARAQKKFTNNKLGVVHNELFGEEMENAHDALGDARAVLRIVQRAIFQTAAVEVDFRARRSNPDIAVVGMDFIGPYKFTLDDKLTIAIDGSVEMPISVSVLSNGHRVGFAATRHTLAAVESIKSGFTTAKFIDYCNGEPMIAIG